MDDLNLARLRAFLLVAEELSFTRAAARRHVAQQALSATIRRLERDVGVRLFDRTRAVQLTPAGHALVRRTRRALDELAHGVADARRADRQGSGSLAIGVMAGAGLARSDVALAWRKGEANPLVRRFVDLALTTARAPPPHCSGRSRSRGEPARPSLLYAMHRRCLPGSATRRTGSPD